MPLKNNGSKLSTYATKSLKPDVRCTSFQHKLLQGQILQTSRNYSNIMGNNRYTKKHFRKTLQCNFRSLKKSNGIPVLMQKDLILKVKMD